jgi:hypothetical protein
MKGDGAPVMSAIAALLLTAIRAPEMSQRRARRAAICRYRSIRIAKVPRD